MSRIRSRDTGPERIVRSLTHRLGYRFRLHSKSLPGHPELVFPSRRKVIFVHGCFWHRHRCRKGRSMPATRIEFWKRKFERNRIRDREVRRALKQLGWGALVIWECQVAETDRLARRIVDFLEGNGSDRSG